VLHIIKSQSISSNARLLSSNASSLAVDERAREEDEDGGRSTRARLGTETSARERFRVVVVVSNDGCGFGFVTVRRAVRALRRRTKKLTRGD